MKRLAPNTAGIALAVVLPWILAAVSVVFAAAEWITPQKSPPPPAAAQPDPEELKTLRLALATETAENTALRGELDRLVGQMGSARPVGSAPPAGTAPSGAAAPGGSELSNRISEALSRAASGDADAAKDGATAMLQALQGGPESAQALREAYLNTADPKARLMMLPTMIFGGGEAAREFIVEQAKMETDPELRAALLKQASGFATPKYAESLKDTFLQTASSEEDAEVRAAAIRGLRYAKGEDVQNALLAAASDPSEEIRLAAIENIASRPALREQLRDTLAQDPSSRVREIGECRLLLSQRRR
jgi:hypothetical protein